MHPSPAHSPYILMFKMFTVQYAVTLYSVQETAGDGAYGRPQPSPGISLTVVHNVLCDPVQGAAGDGAYGQLQPPPVISFTVVHNVHNVLCMTLCRERLVTVPKYGYNPRLANP